MTYLSNSMQGNEQIMCKAVFMCYCSWPPDVCQGGISAMVICALFFIYIDRYAKFGVAVFKASILYFPEQSIYQSMFICQVFVLVFKANITCQS